jgi:hypothetical protein
LNPQPSERQLNTLAFKLFLRYEPKINFQIPTTATLIISTKLISGRNIEGDLSGSDSESSVVAPSVPTSGVVTSSATSSRLPGLKTKSVGESLA